MQILKVDNRGRISFKKIMNGNLLPTYVEIRAGTYGKFILTPIYDFEKVTTSGDKNGK